jgi:hypothetical protein
MKNLFNILPFIIILILNIQCDWSSDNLKNQKSEESWNEAERSFMISGLERTKNELLNELKGLNNEQWSFKISKEKWSIREVVEHLEVQDELYHREIFLVIKTPQSLKYLEIVKGKDQAILNYATDSTKGTAGWSLEPIGRFCSKYDSEIAFIRARDHIIEFVNETNLDLRKFFTFRKYIDDGGLTDIRLWDVRDLHQLLLTTIAHTDRHINQIRQIKQYKQYPDPKVNINTDENFYDQ